MNTAMCMFCTASYMLFKLQALWGIWPLCRSSISPSLLVSISNFTCFLKRFLSAYLHWSAVRARAWRTLFVLYRGSGQAASKPHSRSHLPQSGAPFLSSCGMPFSKRTHWKNVIFYAFDWRVATLRPSQGPWLFDPCISDQWFQMTISLHSGFPGISHLMFKQYQYTAISNILIFPCRWCSLVPLLNASTFRI